MSEERDYKYKLDLVDNVIVIGRIFSDAGRQNQRVLRNKRECVWKPNLVIRKKDMKRVKTSAAMYGEFIAHLLQKKIGFPSCDVDILRRNIVLPFSKSGRKVEVPGCISYLDLKRENAEDLVQAINILAWYKMEHYDDYVKIMNPLGLDIAPNDRLLDVNNESNNNNIELIIPAFEAYAREVAGASEEKVTALRQDLINMVVFDCRFGNTDRNDENYGLAVSLNDMRLYPSFDNEYFLGMSESVEEIEMYSAARLQEHIDKDLTSRMGVSSQVSKLGYQAMLTYLFTTYLEETKRAYEAITQIKEDDLLGIMHECEGLDEVHKDYALRIFRSRKRGFKYVKEEYIDEEGNLIPQVLPGNKPMEVIRRRGGSKSAAVSGKSTKTPREVETR